MQEYELRKYKKVQKIAKETIEYLNSYIQQGVSESDIAFAARKFMHTKGVSSFWYHGVPALVLVGKRTTKSISGKAYKPTSTKVKRNDVVTVDLSPEIDSYWGDFARSFVIGDGRVIRKPGDTPTEKTKELFEGITAEKALHKRLAGIARPSMTFGDLFSEMNAMIEDLGYINLDFKKNLGHSIEKRKEDRIYIEEGCRKKLSEARLFTFEPHIKKKRGTFGYKWEDIYYFYGKRLKIL